MRIIRIILYYIASYNTNTQTVELSTFQILQFLCWQNTDEML